MTNFDSASTFLKPRFFFAAFYCIQNVKVNLIFATVLKKIYLSKISLMNLTAGTVLNRSLGFIFSTEFCSIDLKQQLILRT